MCSSDLPFALIINKVLDKIPGFEKLNIDAEGMKKKFGLLGQCVLEIRSDRGSRQQTV